MQLLSFGDEDREELGQLYRELRDYQLSRCRIGDVPCRVQKVRTSYGLSFAIRALVVSPRPLLELGVPKGVRDILMMKGKIPGLVLVCGAMRSGKTTIAASLVLERISSYGGAAQMIEEPTEMELDGCYGGGLIQQIDVHESGSGLRIEDRVATLAADSLRSDVDILFIGEVRRPADARAVIAVAAIGATVITTIHSTNLETAVERLISLAAAHSNSDEAAAMVANALFAVIHVSLAPTTINTPGGNELRQTLRVRPCFFVGPDADGLRGSVRKQHFAQYVNQVGEMQVQKIINGRSIL